MRTGLTSPQPCRFARQPIPRSLWRISWGYGTGWRLRAEATSQACGVGLPAIAKFRGVQGQALGYLINQQSYPLIQQAVTPRNP